MEEMNPSIYLYILFSFSVASGKNPYKAMTGASSTTYRVKIDDNVSGAKIKGHLRVNQLES